MSTPTACLFFTIFFNLLIFISFEIQRDKMGGSICWLISQVPRTVSARSQEPNPDLLCGWQGPKDLEHPLLPLMVQFSWKLDWKLGTQELNQALCYGIQANKAGAYFVPDCYPRIIFKSRKQRFFWSFLIFYGTVIFPNRNIFLEM